MNNNLKTATIVLSIIIGSVIVFFGFKYFENQRMTTNSTTKEQVGQIISGFPDFPIFPGASVTSSQISQPVSYQVYLESNKPVSEIITWYIQSLSTNGWKIIRGPDPTTPSDQNIIAGKDTLIMSVNVEKAENTIISIDIR